MFARNSSVLSALLLFASATASASIIRVTLNGAGNHSGDAWNNAATLHEALAMGSGNEIWVKADTYKPHAGDRTVHFALPSGGGALYGGFNGTESTRGARDPATNVTTLSGDIDAGDADSYTILFSNYQSAGDYTIDGFTITGGRAFGDPPGTAPGLWETYGAAIYFTGLNGTLTLNNCIFDDNSADYGGGAVSVIGGTSGHVVVTACTFTDNHADTESGGALRIDGCGSLHIDEQDEVGCTFEGNSAYLTGGAVEIQGTSTEISDSWFEANWVEGDTAIGGGVHAKGCGAENGLTFSMTDCTLIDNFVNDIVGGNGYGGGAAVVGFSGDDPVPAATFTRVDFIDNIASHNAGALMLYSEDLEENCQSPPCDINGTCYLGPVLIDDCTFTGNTCDWEEFLEGEEVGGAGGAIWARNVDLTCTNATEFNENISGSGGGAIWHEAFLLGDGSGSYPWFGDANLTLTNCIFRANQMTSTTASGGGGAVFMDGTKNEYAETNLTGTISGCTFIDNASDRGGGIYIHSSDDVGISDCTFVNNDGRKAGGGIGIGDPQNLQTTEVKICKSRFVSNTSLRGGAIHNHEGAVAYMVNCYLTGNSSTKEGGGVFNSRHSGMNLKAELYMHNCLIAGNIADDGAANGDDLGGGVFGGLYNTNAVEALTVLAHCTLLGNHAGQGYGGAVNYGAQDKSFMQFQNCITWGNTDDNGSTDAIAAQLFYAANTLVADDVDNNIIDNLGSDGRFYTSGNPEENKDDDPVFSEDGSSTVTWTWSTYDPDTGETTFSTNDPGSAAVGMLFQPDGPETPMLIITYVGNSSFMCLGWREDTTTTVNITGNLYDLHIDSTGGAYDWGGTDHIPPDVCDLDNDPGTGTLPYDLEPPNERNQGVDPLPDAGVYEIPY